MPSAPPEPPSPITAATIGTRPALREKDRGIWQTYTWAQYYREVSDFALGLAAHGFKRGDKLSVIGDNRPRLYWAQLSAQSLGGIAVPVFQDSIASELGYVFAHAEVSVDDGGVSGAGRAMCGMRDRAGAG